MLHLPGNIIKPCDFLKENEIMWANMSVEYFLGNTLIASWDRIKWKKKKKDTTLIKYQPVSVQTLKIELTAPLKFVN